MQRDFWIIIAISFFATVLVAQAQSAATYQQNQRFLLISANIAGLPGYVGNASADVSCIIYKWLGIRAGYGKSYSVYDGSAQGASVALSVLSPRLERRSSQLELNLGASYMIDPQDFKNRGTYIWQPIVSIGALAEFTSPDAVAGIFGRFGLCYTYSYGYPFYIGFGACF